MNFGIFINIVRIIVQKLRANQIAKNNYKYRLARSTLALIPLLGIHYVVFAFVPGDLEDIEKSNRERPQVYVKIAFEMVFTSFQVGLLHRGLFLQFCFDFKFIILSGIVVFLCSKT